MRLIKSGKYCLIALFLVCMSSSASAAFTFYLVDVQWAGPYETGPGTSVTMLRATDRGGAFTSEYFTLSAVISKTGLATALSSMALNKPLLIRADLAGRGTTLTWTKPVGAVLFSQ